MKKITDIRAAPGRHWVGDGFPVRSLFSYNDDAQAVSPFLLLDYAGPLAFSPAEARRGVGAHPHRGFETVTIVYQGEVAHRDSTGAGGLIGPGDVQWMTAGAGIVHEEFHSDDFTRAGGTLEMVQLWVNLPAAHKMTEPAYQTLLKGDIPELDLPGGAGRLRVIAGDYNGLGGPARTFSPIDVWDLRLTAGGRANFNLPQGHNLLLAVLGGTLQVNEDEVVRGLQLVSFGREGTEIAIEASNEASFLLLSGEPIDEPVVGYGPFVMNTREEIQQAIADFNAGRFARMTA